jgi:carboxymethylenebutenolidase
MCFDPEARPPLPPIRGAAEDHGEVALASADGTVFTAYGALAETPSGSGVVIVPDVRGLHPYYEELAVRFAEAGIDSVAVDLYARTAGRGRRPEGFSYEEHVRQVQLDQVSDDVGAAGAHLRSADGGSAERIYTLGFCLGGRVSFLQATRGHGLAGVIGFYGWPAGSHRSGLPAPADRAREFGCPVLALYGGADPGISSEAIADFDRALDAAGVQRRTIVYDGAPHSFFDRRAAEHADASADAWRQVLDFAGVPG